MNQRDLELLSSYLDGQLKASESTRLEVRLKSDPELASTLNDLRAARTLLRKLPQRRAPRNFTLTRKMVGQNPPLPRAYPFFRFATAIATLLFIFSVGLNSVGSLARPGFGMGGGGGGGPSNQELQSYAATQAPATQPPAAEAPSIAAATQAPAATDEPTLLAPLAPLATQTNSEAANQTRALDTPTANKSAADSNAAGQPPQPQPFGTQQAPVPLVPSLWLIILAGIAILSAILMLLMRGIASSRWRK